MPRRALKAQTKVPALALTPTTFSKIQSGIELKDLYYNLVLILEDSFLQRGSSVMVTEENLMRFCFCLKYWCRHFCDTL